MIPKEELTGAVLAGGESRRMGRDKATLILTGESLWQRQVRVLVGAGATTVGIVRRRGQPALELPKEIKLWHDTVAGVGPLAGLQAALVACPTDWLAVVAIDMPRIDAAWFHWLRQHCTMGCGAIARHPDGIFEPLAAIYPREALPEVSARLQPDAPRSLQSLADTLIGRGLLVSVPIPASEASRVASWNTPADVAALQPGQDQ